MASPRQNRLYFSFLQQATGDGMAAEAESASNRNEVSVIPQGGASASGEVRTNRYYSPLAEISFCGHATIASAVVLGRLSGVGCQLAATAEQA